MHVIPTNGGHLHVAEERVYFAFPDGRLEYDCVTCGAKCCHGMGFEVLAGRELDAQLATSHAVRFFLDPCDAGGVDHFHARNQKPGCFFLSQQNLCTIQLEQGYDAKPETCRLFPFNFITRAGDFLIVAPHTSLCPLTVLPPGQHSDLSRHERILAAMSVSAIGTHVPEVRMNAADVSALVALERRIVDLFDQDLGEPHYAAHAAAQLALTRAAAEGGDAAQFLTRAREDVEQYERLLCEVLDVARPTDADVPIARTMAGATPAIRARFLFGEGATTPSDRGRVPYLLTALHVFSTLAREAGMAAVTYQTIMGLLDAYRPLLNLLSNVDREMIWSRDARVDFAVTNNKAMQASYIGVVKALLPAAQRKRPVPLGHILRDHAPSDSMDRIVLLKLLARRLDGRLVPLTEAAGGSAWRHPRAVAQQFAMGMLGSDVLTVIADRQRSRAARQSSRQ